METRDPQPRAPILVAFSPSTAAREPIEFAHAASRVTGAPLVVVAVKHGGPMVSRFGGDVPEGDEERTLEHLREGLNRRGLGDVEVRVVQHHTAAGGIAHAVEEIKPELIVLGSSHRGSVGSVLVGGTAERVIHDGSSPVAVVPHGYERPEEGVQVIGAAFTPTAEGREALHAGAVLARAAGIRLRAITVLDPEHADEQSHGLMAEQHRETAPTEGKAARSRLGAEAELRAAITELAPDLEVDVDVLVNDPADGLVAASKRVDLMIMGSRALGPRRAVVLGSVSRKVAEGAACPVLILPRGANEQTEALLANTVAQAAGPG